MAQEATDFRTTLDTAPFDYNQLVQMMAPLAGNPTTAPIANLALAKMQTLLGGWKDYVNQISGTLSQATGPAQDQLRQAALAYRAQILDQASQVSQMIFPYLAQMGLQTPQILEKAREFDQTLSQNKLQNEQQYGLLQRQQGQAESQQTFQQGYLTQQQALARAMQDYQQKYLAQQQALEKAQQDFQQKYLTQQQNLAKQKEEDLMAGARAQAWAESMKGLAQGGIHPSNPINSTYSRAEAAGLSQQDYMNALANKAAIAREQTYGPLTQTGTFLPTWARSFQPSQGGSNTSSNSNPLPSPTLPSYSPSGYPVYTSPTQPQGGSNPQPSFLENYNQEYQGNNPLSPSGEYNIPTQDTSGGMNNLYSTNSYNNFTDAFAPGGAYYQGSNSPGSYISGGIPPQNNNWQSQSGQQLAQAFGVPYYNSGQQLAQSFGVPYYNSTQDAYNSGGFFA